VIALAIRYLTGNAVASHHARRDAAEWPPHPARIFMALAAGLFETRPPRGEQEAEELWRAERAALEWLETLAAAELYASEADARSVVTCFVPPNDLAISANPARLKADAVRDALAVLPSLRTNRQPRTFPTVRPLEDTVYVMWHGAEPGEHRPALERLCAKAIRVGHSSSLVQMWLADQAPPATHVPVEKNALRSATTQLRPMSAGFLRYLEEQFNEEAIDTFYELAANVQNSTGRAKTSAQLAFNERFGADWRRGMEPPKSQRPKVSIARGYVRVEDAESSPEIAHSFFSREILVLARQEGPNLGLESTAQLTASLRGAILTACSPAPEWISGHEENGAPLQRPHLGVVPLAYVGHAHADGHVLGLGCIFPRDVSPRERGGALRELLFTPVGEPREIRLTLGRLGIWTLRHEERAAPPHALQPETWTRPSHLWASVTPVALDRHPKIERERDRSGWFAEIAEVIARSCERAGLPAPVEIDFDKTSWHRGAPRAKPGPAGFPLLPSKAGEPARMQVHVWLRFAESVEGPVLIGAGRYRGYGFCKPWAPNQQ
jgi:CRISPR-associated protein Csb2